MSELKINQLRRHRGAILQFVYTGHAEQMSRMDDVALWGLLQNMAFSVGQEEVITLLQQLKARGYLDFTEKKNRWTNRTEITKIVITPAGEDLVEHTKEDPAVLVP